MKLFLATAEFVFELFWIVLAVAVGYALTWLIGQGLIVLADLIQGIFI